MDRVSNKDRDSRTPTVTAAGADEEASLPEGVRRLLDLIAEAVVREAVEDATKDPDAPGVPGA